MIPVFAPTIFIPQPAGAGTDPPSIFGAALVAWFKADAGVYKDAGSTLAVNNDLVQQWNDQSGNGYTVGQTTSNLRPTFLSAGFNSLKTLSFTVSGTGGFLLSPSGQIVMGANGGGTLFVAGTMTTNTQSVGRAVTLIGDSGVNDYASSVNAIWMMRDQGNNNFASYRNLSGNEAVVAISLNTPFRFASVYDKTNVTNYINNTTSSQTADTNSFANTGNWLGIGQAAAPGPTPGSSMWDGNISEIVVVNKAATSTELGLMDTYLKNHWGL